MSARRVQLLVCECGGEMSPVSWYDDNIIYDCSMCIHQVVVLK